MKRMMALLAGALLALPVYGGVDLPDANDTDNINWGNVAGLLDGLTEFSLVVMFKPHSLADTRTIVGDSAFAASGFGVQVTDTDDILVFGITDAPSIYGTQTTTLGLSTGSWVKLVYVVDFSAAIGAANGVLYIDGEEYNIGTDAVSFGSAAPGSLEDSGIELRVGLQQFSAGLDMCVAETAIYAGLLPEADALDISDGASPEDYPTDRIFYWKGLNDTDLDDVDGPIMGTLTGGSDCADHPVDYGGGGGSIIPILIQQL